ncbi:MAG: hypothetical protein HY958_14560 [Bacteroidia bacterium]|nr:hypothetical protein [Bacteroidia bacterium]
MKLIDNIKVKIAYFLLKGKLKKFYREKAFYNFESAKNVGLICNAQDQKIYDQAKRFAVFLTSYNVNVTAIGFIEGDAVLDAFSYQKGFGFISKQSFNWLGFPRGDVVDDFLNKKLDILINLIIEDSLPVDFLVSLSRAKFKVGRMNTKNDYYDLTIDISKNYRLEYFIDQVKHYLTVIKK